VNPESDEEFLERTKAEIRSEAARLEDRPLLERRAPPQQPTHSSASDGIEHNRLDYGIGELTDLHHRAFAEQAFRALLKRRPEQRELDAQLALLARGATKAEVLGNLRYSAEGKRIGTRVGGLLPRYATAKLRRIPVIGYVFDWALTLAGLPLVVRHQRATEALFAAGDAAAADADRALSARIDALDATSVALRTWLGQLQSSAEALGAAQNALRVRTETLESATETHRGRLDELDFLRQRLYALNHWMHHLNLAFAEIENVAAQSDARRDAAAANVALASVGRDATRNARNEAWANQFFEPVPDGGSVLALACASDWLALLAARGARVTGAQANAALAESSRNADVVIEPVSEREALRRIADASVDAVSVLAFSALARGMPAIDFIGEARRVLRPRGALMIAFAREPEALVDALTSHGAAALDPDLIASALAAAGFTDVARGDAGYDTPALFARNAAS